MNKEINLCSLVYRFLVVRIRIGYYQPGDQILIKPICDLFDISNITVRNALKLLEEEHYISLAKNQRAVVIWDPAHPEPLPEEFFVEQDTLVDLNRSYGLLLTEIMLQGLALFRQEALDELAQVPSRPHPASNQPIVYLIKRILEQLGNPLLSILHRDILLFSYPTTYKYLIGDPSFHQTYKTQIQQQTQRAITLCQNRDLEGLKHAMQDSCQLFSQVPDFIERQKTVPASLRPYEWDNGPAGIAVSSALIQQIHAGTYPLHTFLPSNDELARKFHVSTMTIRRAIWLLNDLGVTVTINGIGSKIVPPEQGSKHIKWEDPEIRKNLLLYLQSLQTILVTCRCVAETTLPLLSEGEQQSMAKELEAGVSLGLSHITLGIWFSRFIQYHPWKGIRDIYRRMINLLSWGAPLRYSPKYRRLPNETKMMIDSLRQGDCDRSVDILEQVCFLTYYNSREILLDLGIEGAEAMATPLLDRYCVLVENGNSPS